MLFKSLSRWLNDSLNLLESKTVPPNDYVELKSLIADLKTFRLEEYANKQREKKKLHHIYSELQVSQPRPLLLLLPVLSQSSRSDRFALVVT